MRIVRFSPLHDQVLPPCHMIYLGGGFPEMFPTQLADNRPMRQALLRAGQHGAAIYAECGGLMYLGAALIAHDGTRYPMVGLLRGFSRMSPGLKRFGYCEGRSLTDNLLAGRGETVRGHEFHHSEYITDETPLFSMSKTAANGDVRSVDGRVWRRQYSRQLSARAFLPAALPAAALAGCGMPAMIGISAFIAGYLLDSALGDPPHWPHPVRLMGSAITGLQRPIRRCCRSERLLYIGGGVLWLAVVGGTWLATILLLRLLAFTPWLHWLAEAWLTYQVLAARGLRDAAMAVHHALRMETLAESRRQLSSIVGRDTQHLSRPQIMRAVVETVAENSVDGVIAPLFWLFIGGVPLAMAYKAVNTLDSMVGYRTPKYRAIGYVPAKLDDLANWLPARLGWVALSLSAGLLRLDGRGAWRIGWRDRYQHKSPNCAWSEATVAGALGIRLGGPNRYFNEMVEKPWIGVETRDIALEDITAAIRLMYLASALTMAFLCLLRIVAADYL